MLHGIRGGIGWNILSSLMQLFVFLAAISNLKLEETFKECVVNQLLQPMAIKLEAYAAKINRGFSKHAGSKEHLTCYSTWKEKMKRSEMGKEIISLINTEAIERNRYYFSTLIDIRESCVIRSLV